MSNTDVSIEDLVMVVGATGGVGQLVVSKLLNQGSRVKVLTRSAQKARNMFSDSVDIVVSDLRQSDNLPALISDVTHIICCVGTTAFPSTRWEFDKELNPLEWIGVIFQDRDLIAQAKNSPDEVDAKAVSNLVSAVPNNLKRFVFVSSCGVKRKDQFPYSLLNAFGVLDAKEKGEQSIINSGIPYTIVRPGRLIDGPYTSYDLNTLTRATTDGKLDIVVGTGDTLTGQTSRIDVANVCVKSLYNPNCENKAFEVVNQGKRPSAIDWDALLAQI
ncbi:MAG: SDR family oxidoreductase [Cyanobacteria bacterium P01_A01_bin.45]